MRTNWKTKKLEDICDFHSGLWKGKTPPYVRVGVIRNTNFTKDGGLDYSDVASLDVEKNQFLTRALRYGDIILEKSGGGPKQPVGRVAVFNRESGNFSFSNFTSAIRIKNSKEVDCKYLHKYLFASYISGATETMQRHSTGIRNLKLSEYKQIPVPIPSLQEQKRIGAVLDEAFAAIAKAKENAEKNLDNAHKLYESHIQNIFTQSLTGWKPTTLGETCDFHGGGTPSKAISRYWQGKIPWVSPKDMKFEVVSDSIDHISREAIEGSATSLIPKGSVLMVVRSGILARIVPLALTGCELTINQDIKAICPKSIIKSRFLYFLLESKMHELLSLVSRGATVHRLITDQIRSLSFYLPPQGEQDQIIKGIETMRKGTQRLEFINQQKLSDLEELKKSILQKAFSGELVGARS